MLRPTREALLGDGHQLLVTSLGPLDVLGAIEGGRGFECLAPESVEIGYAGSPPRAGGRADPAGRGLPNPWLAGEQDRGALLERLDQRVGRPPSRTVLVIAPRPLRSSTRPQIHRGR
jgi:hypothetical protein